MALISGLKNLIKPVIKFKEFSKKQMQLLTWWCPYSPYRNYDGIIADGSIRAGKTVSMAISFIIWLMDTYDGQNFAMCGKTVGSFRRNVWKWLKPVLVLRGYHIEESKTENLIVIAKGKKINYIYVFGGRDESSQDLIQGITLAGVFFDEVALMPESFVNQATGRCSVERAKMWFNCNPDSPMHWFLNNWIRQKEAKKMLHIHFTMDDNPSLSNATRERYKSMYSGVFYQRFILGLW
ncbi:MAG: PBSX family phage terminase large subunit [Bacteroides sp.]